MPTRFASAPLFLSRFLSLSSIGSLHFSSFLHGGFNSWTHFQSSPLLSASRVSISSPCFQYYPLVTFLHSLLPVLHAYTVTGSKYNYLSNSCCMNFRVFLYGAALLKPFSFATRVTYTKRYIKWMYIERLIDNR